METYIWASLVLNALSALMYLAVMAIGRVPYSLTITPFALVVRLSLTAAAVIWAAAVLGVL